MPRRPASALAAGLAAGLLAALLAAIRSALPAALPAVFLAVVPAALLAVTLAVGATALTLPEGVLGVARAAPGVSTGIAAKPKVRYHQAWAERPSARYAAMTASRCRDELSRRGIRAEPVARAPGVMAPVRLPEGAGGVVYRTAAPAHARAGSPGDVFDCRLALALADLGGVLRARGIHEARILSAWRPDPRLARLARLAALPSARPALRHAGALAVDLQRLGRLGKGAPGAPGAPDEGARTWIDVEHDFDGALGAPVCAQGGTPPDGQAASPAARELRGVVCEAAARHLFTSILTPNYDRAHKNHVHLELTPGVEWELLR